MDQSKSSINEAEEEEMGTVPEKEFRKLIIWLLRSNQKQIQELIEKHFQEIEIKREAKGKYWKWKIQWTR